MIAFLMIPEPRRGDTLPVSIAPLGLTRSEAAAITGLTPCANHWRPKGGFIPARRDAYYNHSLVRDSYFAPSQAGFLSREFLNRSNTRERILNQVGARRDSRTCLAIEGEWNRARTRKS